MDTNYLLVTDKYIAPVINTTTLFTVFSVTYTICEGSKLDA